ncbi:hypothetical protein JHK87_016024 [Glycine soja]|nr:hypothetical protein JHK87_016024 [Glycine soja]
MAGGCHSLEAALLLIRIVTMTYTLFYPILMIFMWVSFTFRGSDVVSVKSAHVLDLIMRDQTFKTLNKNLMRTTIA